MRAWLVLMTALFTVPLLGDTDPGNARPALERSGRDRHAVPPVAVRGPVVLHAHGIERVDDYAWMRDPNWRDVMADPARLAPEIHEHIAAENQYSDAALAPLSDLRVKLLGEMKGRIEKHEASVPAPDGPYAYQQTFRPDAEHPLILRTSRAGGNEELILDGPALAEGKAYFSFGGTHHSPDHRLYAYTVDDTGSESHSLHIRDIAAKRELPDIIPGVADFTWAQDSTTLFYVRLDDDHRARYVYRHRVGTDPANDQLVFEEPDPGFAVSVYRTRTGRYVAITTVSSDMSETHLIDAARPDSAAVLVAQRAPDLRYDVDDWGDRLVIRTNDGGADDFKVVTAPLATPGREHWTDLVPYREGRQILSALPFARHLVTLEREDGLERLLIRRKDDGASHVVAFDEEAYDLALGGGYEFDTPTLRFAYSSPATPQRTYDYDMDSRERLLRKAQVIPSGHDPSQYVVRRLAATAADGERVPITLLHRKGLTLDGAAPLFLEGYGAYGSTFATQFDTNILSLVDRGFVYGIAHIRGGLEKGERWRDAGRRERKRNSFTDFIAVAEHLIATGYTATGRIVARGDSAGGLLMGAVANMRPELFAGMIARVPFVDAINTMLDDTLPLTVSDFPEWGNPIADKVAYDTIASYSPYDNVARQEYPHMLVTAGISDPRVQYWEPAKWVAKLRAMKTNDARITLVTRMAAGHFGASGRFESLEEDALLSAFALETVGRHLTADHADHDARPPSQIVAPAAGAPLPSAVDAPPMGGQPTRSGN
jgi:oligopeptidase B